MEHRDYAIAVEKLTPQLLDSLESNGVNVSDAREVLKHDAGAIFSATLESLVDRDVPISLSLYKALKAIPDHDDEDAEAIDNLKIAS
ncbi:MAG: hypothetical protein Q4C71_05735 [Microbacteriaceae bacterium]|nr:hypothetical protein [Microbacteriaceae bacterium]